MATAGSIAPAESSKPMANPWPWMALGGAFVLWSYLWTLCFHADANDGRVIVLAVGFLFAGVGVWLRWNDRHTLFLAPGHPVVAQFFRLALGLVFLVIGAGIAALFCRSLFYSAWDTWKPGVSFLILLSAGPPSYFAMRRCFKQRAGSPSLDAEEEIGLCFAVAGFYCLGGSFTLYLGAEPDLITEWDTMRLFLRVLASVCLFASALVLVTQRLRRLTLSVLVALHFAAITTASLATPPNPAIITQVWIRIFRPYLEFMCMNFAYHYYAPDPNPASYLWFRVVFDGPNDQEQGVWYKIPDIDDEGRSNHPADLEKQRFVAMTQTIFPFETNLPPPMIMNDLGMTEMNPIYAVRMALSVPRDRNRERVGKGLPQHYHIPFDPWVLPAQQFVMPNETSRGLLASYARFVARKFAQESPHGATFKFTKVYRVEHEISQTSWLIPKLFDGKEFALSPADPQKYHPYYLGKYDGKGELVEDRDPYRYWILPNVRTEPLNPYSKILSFVRLHAGDSDWVRPALNAGKPPAWGPDDEELKKYEP